MADGEVRGAGQSEARGGGRRGKAAGAGAGGAYDAYSRAAHPVGSAVAARVARASLDIPLPGAPIVTGTDSVRVAAVKRAEKGRGLIVRLAEFRGGECRGARVTLPAGARRVERVNLLERAGEPLAIENGAVTLTLRPWEIATLRVSP